MTEKYSPGTFCIDSHCPKHKDLEQLEGDAYLEEKKKLCRDCVAWKFFLWLGERDFRILRTFDEIPAKELAARLKGIDPVKVEHLSIEEILCL